MFDRAADSDQPGDLPAAAPGVWAGIDLGGTNIKLGIVDGSGQTLGSITVPTDVSRGPQAGLERMVVALRQALVAANLPPGGLTGIGLAAPGAVDRDRRCFVGPANLPGWSEYPLADRLSAEFGCPTFCVNDGNAAGYGEFWIGSGRDLASMVMFTLGTGVGGSIFVGDTSVDGAHGCGAELGHTIIDYNENAARCSCGQRGHLEAYLGAPAVVRRAAEGLAAAESSLRERTQGGEVLTPLMVAEEAERGDAVALAVVLETARYLGIAAVNALHTIDPAGIIVGGAMTFGGQGSHLGRRFLVWVREEMDRRALPGLADQVAIEFARLGADAGYTGAAGLARLAGLKPGSAT